MTDTLATDSETWTLVAASSQDTDTSTRFSWTATESQWHRIFERYKIVLQIENQTTGNCSVQLQIGSGGSVTTTADYYLDEFVPGSGIVARTSEPHDHWRLASLGGNDFVAGDVELFGSRYVDAPGKTRPTMTANLRQYGGTYAFGGELNASHTDIDVVRVTTSAAATGYVNVYGYDG